MPSKGFLRLLIVSVIALGITGDVVSLRTESSLPDPLRTFLILNSQSGVKLADWVGIFLVISLVVSSVGLFVFWRPARLLYLLTTIMGLLLTPFLGPEVDTG